MQPDWNREGQLADFIGAVEDWHFHWLDVPAMIRSAAQILEYPIVDQDRAADLTIFYVRALRSALAAIAD